MASLGVDAGSDLGPWAAYVVGRHPYALAGWHTESWAMRESGTILDRGHLYGAPQELEELDEALTILACQGRVDSAVLDSYRRSLGRFVAVSKEIYENSENPLYGGVLGGLQRSFVHARLVLLNHDQRRTYGQRV